MGHRLAVIVEIRRFVARLNVDPPHYRPLIDAEKARTVRNLSSLRALVGVLFFGWSGHGWAEAHLDGVSCAHPLGDGGGGVRRPVRSPRRPAPDLHLARRLRDRPQSMGPAGRP